MNEGNDNLEFIKPITTLIEARSKIYKSAVIESVLVSDGQGGLRNGFTRIILSDEDQVGDALLDYTNVVYLKKVVTIEGLNQFLDTLATKGKIELLPYTADMYDSSSTRQSFNLREEGLVSRSHYWLESDWPADAFTIESNSSRIRFSHKRLVALDLPLYPDEYHLVRHKMGVDLSSSNGLINSVMMYLPNYQARFGGITWGLFPVTVNFDLRKAEPSNLLLKVFASDGKDVRHIDVDVKDSPVTVEFGFTPLEAELCLIDKQSNEIVDQISVRPTDISWNESEHLDPNVLEFLIQQGEGLRLEFKPGKLDEKDREEIAETVVAFSNHSGGSILVGVRDDGTIVGCFEEEVVDRITKSLADRCDPPMEVRIEQVVIEDKPVYIVVVRESENKPHSMKNRGFFMRHGSNDYIMTRTELDEIMIHSGRRNGFPDVI